MAEKIRLQVALSRTGAASRRKSASIIEEGRVFVNGVVVHEKGFSVDPHKDKIVVDGRRITYEKKLYILLNKPKGFITSRHDPEMRKTVFDILPTGFERLHTVGRLDKDTSGLLLLTNDGEFTYKLTHPKFEIKKKYKIRCKGEVSGKEKERLERGLFIEGRKTARANVEILHADAKATDLFITIHEGRKRQIRKMFLFLGHPIKQLERIVYGSLRLGSIKRGEFRYLTRSEVNRLKEL